MAAAPHQQRHSRLAVLTLVGATTACFGAAFVSPPRGAGSQLSGSLRGKVWTSPVQVSAVGDGAAPSSRPGAGWGFAAAAAAAAAWLARASGAVPSKRGGSKDSFAVVATAPCEGVPTTAVTEPVVAMRSDGGRRKRLGVGGRVCMLTGKKKKKLFYRTFSEHKNKRYYRPNVMWKKLWWPREKKFVRLFVSARAIRKVDAFGLEKMARWAGLDLYAWCLPHWMPGSRQPLALRVGYSDASRRDKMFWPDYLKDLNKGQPLAAIRGAPIRPPPKPAPWQSLNPKGPGTPPKRLTLGKGVKYKLAEGL